MKKTLIALAAIAATSAFAQSTVNIGGSIEFVASRSVAGDTAYGANKGDRNHLTFSGSEDLGNGLSANFTLQHRFRSENGQAGTYMVTNGAPVACASVTTTVAAIVSPATTPVATSTCVAGAVVERTLFEQTALGLTSKTLGAVRVGRFTNILGFNSYNFQEDSGYGAGTSSQYGRLSGQLQYTTPEVSGFKYTYLTATRDTNKYGTVAGNGFGTGTATGATQNLVAHTVTYNGGPVFAQGSIVTGLQGEASYHLGGTYNLGNGLKLGVGQFSQTDAVGTQAAHKNNYVGAEYTTGAWVTALTFSKASDSLYVATTAGAGQAQKMGVKAYYSLSKRTTLEFEAANNKDFSTAADGSAYFGGVRHTF